MHKKTKTLKNYIPTIDFSNKYPDAKSPISFEKNGDILSCFGDSTWNFSNLQLGYSNSNILDFTEDTTGLNIDTLYHIRLLIYYDLFYANKINDVISYKTIKSKYSRFRSLATYFQASNSSFLNLKKNGLAQKKYLNDLSLNKERTITSHIQSCSHINSVGAFFGIKDFGFDELFLAKIQQLKEKSVRSRKQTILIPSRIYSEFIKSGLEIFNKFNKSSNVLRDVFISSAYINLNPNTGRVNHLFVKFAKKHGFIDFINDFEVKTASAFLTRLSQIQAIGFLLIACFSGMRNSEIKALGQDCLSLNIVEGKQIYTLKGYTSKTSNVGLRKATWITSELVLPVIEALKVLNLISKIYNEQRQLYKNIALEEYPLFSHLTFSRDQELKGSNSLYAYPPTLLNSLDSVINQLIKNIDVRKEDINELNQFNPLINWCEEHELEIGRNWKFRPHQFRRSLVVYGVRSGMIQLSVLKKQLQHLSIDMTTYYGNYAGTANNLFDESILEEFKEENIRYQFVQYERKVINSTDTLFGGEGTRLHLSKRLENVPEYLIDKEKTLQYFNEGRMAYKKTPLGGCSKIGACDKLGFSYITACIDCKDSIFDSSSKVALKKTKQAYFDRLKKYDFDSVTYKQLQIEINSINKILNKVEILEINNV